MDKTIDHRQSNQTELAQSSRQTILVIDDCADALLLNKTVLELEDYEVFTAQSATDAFAILEKIPPPQLILLDMKMDEMSGLEFLDRLENDRPEIVESVPIVFMSGIDEIPQCKVTGFIKKPVEIADLVQRVHQFIETGSNPIKH